MEQSVQNLGHLPQIQIKLPVYQSASTFTYMLGKSSSFEMDLLKL